MQTPDDAELSPYAGLAHKIRGGKSATAIDHENRPPSLTVTRATERSGLLGGLFGAISSLVTIKVELNGQIIGKLREGDRLTVDVTPGEHTLRVTAPMSISRRKSFVVHNGQRVKFSCATGTMLWRQG